MNKGIKRMKREMDISKILKALQEFKQSKSAMFDRNDTILLQLQKGQVISSEDSSSQSEDDNFECIYENSDD